jgi:hypothetical protein
MQRKRTLALVEKGKLFAYQVAVPGGNLVFSDKQVVYHNLVSVSLEELKLIFKEDIEREKAGLN